MTSRGYAESQALWDWRRTLAWLRANESGARVGVYGISLGGYNAALLSGYDKELDFVVAGIPVVDLAQALWSFAPPGHRAYYAEHGLTEALRSEEHTSELQSLMRISYAVFCLKKKNT